jgi:PKHD-type hydroxylase
MNLQLPPRSPDGLSSHAFWEDFLSNEEILTLLSVKEWVESKKGLVGSDVGDGTYSNQIRDSDVGWLGVTNETSLIWEKILHAVGEVNRRFFQFDLTGCYEPAQLTSYHYSQNQHYSWHIDSAVCDGGVPRKLSMSLLLSHRDEFVGGEFQMMIDSDNPITVEQKRGRAWFFPSYVLHRVTPVTKGLRRSLVLWVGGPSFR